MTTVKAAKKKSSSASRKTTASVSEQEQLLVDCQELLKYQFQDVELLISSLTHASSADSRVVSNERLEFLGDSVLGLVICEVLYHRFPQLLEGELTKIKSVVVSRRTCARISRQLGMERFLILGKGMASQSVIPASVMADVFESLIAAIYLDGGIDPAREFVLSHTEAEIEKAASGHHGGNFKSILQQMSQKEFGATPTYEMLEEQGPDHSKLFRVTAVIGNFRYPAAWGRNKKEAEQRAALNALCQIGGREVPYAADD
ncbi:Ribonuclease 3 [Planctomycetes bacterium Pan216]|uniref:Ribonuclease 3 n=1 Tax=Kolteria novifilia TaxID=2527975 RepID=A0A518BCY7_9BACT|nr:Ribonuclease 3 [Planctomycetes bacterium Pan216]